MFPLLYSSYPHFRTFLYRADTMTTDESMARRYLNRVIQYPLNICIVPS